MEQGEVRVGTQVTIMDCIDPSIANTGSVKFIEPDTEDANLVWLYVRANDETLNTQVDPRIPTTFWRVIELNAPELIIQKGWC